MPKPVADKPLNAYLYPEGGPGRQLKARLRAGEVLVGGMIAEYVRPSLVKCFQQAGCDFIYIEFEHGYFDLTALADTVQAARDNGLPVIAKTPQLERAAVAKLLECGVVGLQLPRTESREDIETLRSYLKFPPLGTRAAAPGYGNSDYCKVADHRAWMAAQDEETSLVVHIETRQAYERAEEIVSTPGWIWSMSARVTFPWKWGSRDGRTTQMCAARWKRSYNCAKSTESRSALRLRDRKRPSAGWNREPCSLRLKTSAT